VLVGALHFVLRCFSYFVSLRFGFLMTWFVRFGGGVYWLGFRVFLDTSEFLNF
jgi:hypothetical protein